MKVFNLADNGVIHHQSMFLTAQEADELYNFCENKTDQQNNIPWDQTNIVVGERRVLEPRFTAFIVETNGLHYTYSSKLNIATEWPEIIRTVKQKIEDYIPFSVVFNVVLMNWYGYGGHHVGWHSDSETDLISGTPIVSLSLGATRTFQLRHYEDSRLGSLKTELNTKVKNEGYMLSEEEEKIVNYQVGEDPDWNMEIDLSHGDLLVMSGDLQKFWRHRIPIVKQDVAPRIVFTFRCVDPTSLILPE